MSQTLTVRQKAILMHVIECKHCITGSKLAQICKISDKTLRNEIKLLQAYIVEYGGQIISVPSQGYHFNILDEVRFALFQKQLIYKGSAPNNPIERAYYIIAYLLQRTDPIKIDDLSELLYIERTTVSRDLKYVRECLTRFSLDLTIIPKQGIIISGSEFHWRLCMAEYVYHKPHLITCPLQRDEACVKQIEDCLQRDGIVLSHMSLQNLLIHMQVQMDRSELHRIDITEMDGDRLCLEYEFLVAIDLAKIIQENYAISLSQEECCYLAIHLLGKRINSISAVESCINDSLLPEVEQLLKAIFEHIEQRFHIDFKEDLYLRKALGIHIIPMLERLKFHTYLRNPLLYEIKQKYLLSCLIARELMQFLAPAYINLDDEIAYIALHIQYALERKNRQKSKKRVLVINDHSGAATELLNFYLLKRFNEVMSLKYTIYSHDLQKYNMEDYDLIITTVALEQRYTIPVVKISSIQTFEQLDQLESYFEQHIHLLASTYIKVHTSKQTIAFQDANAIMKYLYDCFVGDNDSKKKEAFLQQERYGSSELDSMIALPYLFCEEDSVVHVIQLKKPIIWSNKMVKTIVFLKLSTKENLIVFFEHLGKWIEEQAWNVEV